MSSGIAILITSSGSRTMYSPFNENISTIVNKRAISVRGLTRGTKLCSYHCPPFAQTSIVRVRNPAMNGIPRYTNTLLAIWPIETSTTALRKPK